MRRLPALVIALTACLAQAAPYTPKADNEVLERLPFRANAPEGRELRAMRRAFAEQPQDLTFERSGTQDGSIRKRHHIRIWQTSICIGPSTSLVFGKL